MDSSNLQNKQRVAEELQRAQIKWPDMVLQVSEFHLLRLGSLTTDDIENTTTAAAAALLQPGFMTALDVEKQLTLWHKLSTGCSVLDRALGGGFLTRGITEIAGESGCGKTQLCLQLCLSVQYPESAGGLGAGAVFICTEDSFPSRRMAQLFETHPKRRCITAPSSLPVFGDSIFIEHIADPEGMRQCVLGRLPKLMSKTSIRLIVIDSIAGVYRSSYETSEIKDRAQDMRRVGGQLHSIARQFKACVVCVNQVGALVSSKDSSSFSGVASPNVPALGLAWANMVTTRIQMHRFNPSSSNSSLKHYFEVIFAPHLPQSGVSYTIDESGVFGVS